VILRDRQTSGQRRICTGGAGGEAAPIRSADLKLVDKVSWPVANRRVDRTEECPIAGLASLWEVYKPQMDAYVIRALNRLARPAMEFQATSDAESHRKEMRRDAYLRQRTSRGP
jgi:hypothetical protein